MTLALPPTSPLTLRHPGSIDELLNYRLLKLYAQSGAPVIRLLEGRFGIARREWRLIGLLAMHGALSPSALAREADLDRPRTSRALGVLVTKGLVVRQALPGDARQARVALTEAGQQLYRQILPEVAAINRAVLEGLSDEQVALLDGLLQALTARSREVNATYVRDVSADRRAGGSRRIRR